jgi:hypothetical protein
MFALPAGGTRLERDQTNLAFELIFELICKTLLQDNPLRCPPLLDLAPRELGWVPQLNLVLRWKTAIAYLWESIARWQF